MNKPIDIFDYTSIFLLILFRYLSFYSILNHITNIILFIAIFILILKIITKKYSVRQMLTILLLGFCCFIITITTESVDFLISYLLAINFNDKSIRSLIKGLLLSVIFCYILTLILNLFGIIESNVISRVTEEGVISRSSLGFTHANDVFKHFIIIFICTYLLSDKKIYIYILIFFSVILYALSNSRTGIMCILILSVIVLFKRRVCKLFEYINLNYIYLVFTIFTVLMSTVFYLGKDSLLNTLLSNRLYLYNYYITNNHALTIFGISLFENMVIDNIYLRTLVDYGIITWIIYYFIYYFSLKKISKDNVNIKIAIFMFCIYGLFENVFAYHMNFSLMLLLLILISNKDRINLELSNENLGGKNV